MPVISVTMGEGQATAKQKEELIERFTASAVDITGIPAHAFTILIHELKAESIGVGGKPLTEVMAAMAG